MIWFISDEHYGHEAIIRYCGRPFADAAEMGHAIRKACMSAFRKGDTVWHLGDYGFYDESFSLRDMPGTHLITRGNHDRGPVSLANAGFTVVESAVVRWNGKNILLRHKPLYDPLPEGIDGVFHGHIHNGLPEDLIAANERPIVPWYNVNLCVEKTQYKPVSYKIALRMLAKQRKTYEY